MTLKISACVLSLVIKKKPDFVDQAQCSNEVSHMNYSILADIELNRKISLFQKAVEAYAIERSLKNSVAVAEAKSNLERHYYESYSFAVHKGV